MEYAKVATDCWHVDILDIKPVLFNNSCCQAFQTHMLKKNELINVVANVFK